MWLKWNQWKSLRMTMLIRKATSFLVFEKLKKYLGHKLTACGS